MRKTSILLVCIFFYVISVAQEKAAYRPAITVKWAPTGLILGSLSFQGEYNFGGRSSLTAKIGIPVNARHSFDYEGEDAKFGLKATSFLAGYRMYLSKNHLHGLYFEPYFKYVNHTSEGSAVTTLDGRKLRMNFSNDYSGGGVGAQLGAQFLISKRFVVDFFFLGPEINSAKNNFKAYETGSMIEWNAEEGAEAHADIKDFIDDFPFIRNKTNVRVDEENRSVMANFKGALPGFRIGVSFGIAF